MIPAATATAPSKSGVDPARYRRIYAICCLSLAIAAFVIDMPLVRLLHQAHFPGDLRKLFTFSEVFGHGIGVALIIATAATLDDRRWATARRLALHAYGAGLTADAMKVLIGRCRPSHLPALDADVWSTFVGFFPAATTPEYAGVFDARFASFPSAHAATAAGLAIGLSNLYPRGRWLFAAFALLAGFQRCFCGAHFASDVFAGYGVAFLISVLCVRQGRVGESVSKCKDLPQY